MLMKIHDHLKGAVAWIIVILISIPFALWGIQEYLTPGGSSALTINGEKISMADYDREYASSRQQTINMFGGKIPAFLNDGEFIRKQAIDRLTNRTLLVQTIEKHQLRVSGNELYNNIKNLPAFQTDGKFDSEAYDLQLRSMGQSKKSFENDMRNQLLANQYRQGLAGSSFISLSELKAYAKLKNQTRTIDYVVLSGKTVDKDISVSEEEINNYYTANANDLMTEAQVTAEYIELNIDEISKEIGVTETLLKELYDSAIASGNYTTAETRVASHILINVPKDAAEDVIKEKQAKAEAILAQVKSGADFAELAKQNSEDPGSATAGGSLGTVNRGAMVKPFEDALFALTAAGDTSELVRSTFGFHIIKLTAINAEVRKPFAEVRQQLEADYRNKEADTIFSDRAEILASQSFENQGSLEPAASALGVTPSTVAGVTKQNGTGIAAHFPVREALFSDGILLAGNNSERIEVGPGHVVVVRVREHTPSKQKTLDETRVQITEALKAEKRASKLAEIGAQLKVTIEAEGLSPALANKYNSELKTAADLTRDSKAVAANIVDAAFKLRSPAEGQTMVATTALPDGNYAVVLLKSVQSPDAAWIAQEEGKKMQKELAEARAIVEYGATQEAIKQNSEIIVYSELK